MNQFKSVHRDARAIIQSLPILAAVMAEDIGVTVRFAQDVHTGMTDGMTIVLPTVPLPTKSATPEELQKLATYYFGLEDHEIGHCRVSDLPSISQRLHHETPLVKSLFNVIEDPRMEDEHSQSYPGADRNMRKLSVQLVDDKHDNPISAETPVDVAITCWICHYLRFAVRNEDCYRPHAEQGEQVLISAIGANAVSRIKGYLAKAPSLRSSLDSFNLAKQIANAIVEESKRVPPVDVPNDGQQQQNSDPANKAGPSTSSGDDNPGKSTDDNTSSEATVAQTQALQSVTATTNIHPDRGDAVREILSADIEKIIGQGHAVRGESLNAPVSNIHTSKPREISGVIDLETVCGVSARARTRLASILQAETRERSRLSKRGKHIDTKQLHRLRTGDYRIFRSVQASRSLDTALFLLLDVSGSMVSGGAIEIAREAMLATALATGMLKGVAVATGTFPQFHMIQSFGTKARMVADQYAVAATGSNTPLAEGLMWAGKQLIRRREARKVLIVATDGIPDSIGAAQAAVEMLGSMQVDVIGYGISIDIENVIPRSQMLESVNELPDALMAMLKDLLSLSLAA